MASPMRWSSISDQDLVTGSYHWSTVASWNAIYARSGITLFIFPRENAVIVTVNSRLKFLLTYGYIYFSIVLCHSKRFRLLESRLVVASYRLKFPVVLFR